MINRPVSVTIAILLIIPVNALAWLGFAVLTAPYAYPGLPDATEVRWIMAILAFGFGGVWIAPIIPTARCVRFTYFFPGSACLPSSPSLRSSMMSDGRIWSI
jgi:hypothetical protein